MSTTTTTLNDIITPAGVERLRQLANLPPGVGMQIAWIEAVDGKSKGSSVTIPRADAIAVPAGTKSQNAQFTSVDDTTSGVSVTSGVVGFRGVVSREAMRFSPEDTLAAVIRNRYAAIMNRIDIDLLTAASGAANSTDLATAALTEADMDDFISAYSQQSPQGVMHALVLHPAQIADWKADIRTTGGGAWLGGDAESERVAKLYSVGAGYKGAKNGFAVFESSNVVVAAGEASGFACTMGVGGALAMRSWTPLSFEVDWQATYLAMDVVVYAEYGVAVANPANIRTLISASA